MSYIERAAKYADDIVSKKIPSCIHTQNACKRFIKDLSREDLELKTDKAEKWCKFLEKLPHVKGKWAKNKEKFKLSDWQVFCTVNIYGWYWKKKQRRRFRVVYIEVPRKNGKSFWVAGLGLGHLIIDDEFGAEVYCGATTEKQAWEVFKPAHSICERTPSLVEKFGIDVRKQVINVLQTGSKFEPVIGNPGDGSSPSNAIVDEFHEHKNPDQIDTFETGMAARENPLLTIITTAGNDMGGPCYERRSDVINILSGTVEDDSIFGIIYTVDDEDPWDTLEAQIKANPNFGISVDEDFLAGKLAQARRSPSKQTAYKTKHLNLWVGAMAAWMNMLAFQACRKKDLNIESLKGRRCFAALDLASKTDFASKAILFPPFGQGEPWKAFVRHYLPESTIEENKMYSGWHAHGWITSTPGNVIDYEYIEDDLRGLKSLYEVVEVPYDPFQATQFSTRMMGEGFPMVEVGATVKNFSEPMKELESLILTKNIHFEMDPVLLWMFGNVVAKEDRKENIFPNKEVAKNKIDGVVALIMALNRAMFSEEGPSVYESRGIVTL